MASFARKQTNRNQRPTLEELRSLIGEIDGSVGREYLGFSLLPAGRAGVPLGALTEFSGEAGAGKTEAVLRLLAEHPHTRVAWIEDILTAYPVAFEQNGVGLGRVLFAEAGGDALWGALQVLRSLLFQVVVLSLKQTRVNDRQLRRLQMAAERSGAALILLNGEPTWRGSWPITVQFEVSRNGRGEPQIHPVQARGITRGVKPWNASSETSPLSNHRVNRKPGAILEFRSDRAGRKAVG